MASMTESRHVDIQHAEAAEKLRQEKLRLAREEYERRQTEKVRKLQEAERHAQEVRELTINSKRDELMERHKQNEERRAKAEERRKNREKAAQMWRQSVMEKLLHPSRRSTSASNRARSAHSTVGERMRSKSEYPKSYAFGSSTPRVVCWGIPNSIPPTKPASGLNGMAEPTTGFGKKDNSRMFQSLHADFASRPMNKLSKDTSVSKMADPWSKKSGIPKTTTKMNEMRKNSLDSSTVMSRSTVVPSSQSRSIRERLNAPSFDKDGLSNAPQNKRNEMPSDGAGTRLRVASARSSSAARNGSRTRLKQAEQTQPDLVMSVNSRNVQTKDTTHSKPLNVKNVKREATMKRATSLNNKEEITKRLEEENVQQEKEIASYKAKMAEQRNLARERMERENIQQPSMKVEHRNHVETPEEYKETPSEVDQSTSIEPQSTSDEEEFHGSQFSGQTPNSECENVKSMEERERDERRRRVEDIMSRINRHTSSQNQPATATYSPSFMPPLTPCEDYTSDDTSNFKSNEKDALFEVASHVDEENFSHEMESTYQDESQHDQSLQEMDSALNEQPNQLRISDEPALSDMELVSGADEVSKEVTERRRPTGEELKGDTNRDSIELIYGSYSSGDENAPDELCEDESVNEGRDNVQSSPPCNRESSTTVKSDEMGEEISPHKPYSENDDDTFNVDDMLNKSFPSFGEPEPDEFCDSGKSPVTIENSFPSPHTASLKGEDKDHDVVQEENENQCHSDYHDDRDLEDTEGNFKAMNESDQRDSSVSSCDEDNEQQNDKSEKDPTPDEEHNIRCAQIGYEPIETFVGSDKSKLHNELSDEEVSDASEADPSLETTPNQDSLSRNDASLESRPATDLVDDGREIFEEANQMDRNEDALPNSYENQAENDFLQDETEVDQSEEISDVVCDDRKDEEENEESSLDEISPRTADQDVRHSNSDDVTHEINNEMDHDKVNECQPEEDLEIDDAHENDLKDDTEPNNEKEEQREYERESDHSPVLENDEDELIKSQPQEFLRECADFTDNDEELKKLNRNSLEVDSSSEDIEHDSPDLKPEAIEFEINENEDVESELQEPEGSVEDENTPNEEEENLNNELGQNFPQSHSEISADSDYSVEDDEEDGEINKEFDSDEESSVVKKSEDFIKLDDSVTENVETADLEETEDKDKAVERRTSLEDDGNLLNGRQSDSLNFNNDDMQEGHSNKPFQNNEEDPIPSFQLSEKDRIESPIEMSRPMIDPELESHDSIELDEDEISSSSVKVHRLADDAYESPFMNAAGPYPSEGVVIGKPSLHKIRGQDNEDDDKHDESGSYGGDEEDVSDIILPSSDAHDLPAIKEVEENSDYHPQERFDEDGSGTESDLGDSVYDHPNHLPQEDTPHIQGETENDTDEDEPNDEDKIQLDSTHEKDETHNNNEEF